MATPDSNNSNSITQNVHPTNSNVNGSEGSSNPGATIHSTGHLGQSSLRMNNPDFNRPEIPVGTGFHNSSPKKSIFQSRLAHFQQLALNNNNTQSSTREIHIINAPPIATGKLRNYNIPPSIREIDSPNSVPSTTEKIKPPNINTQLSTREIHSIDVAPRVIERAKYDNPQPNPREIDSINPASIVTGLRKPPGNDFQSRLAHFRELALNNNNNTGFDTLPVGGRGYSGNVMTAPPSPIHLQHFPFHKRGAASVSNVPTNLLHLETDATPQAANTIPQGDSRIPPQANTPTPPTSIRLGDPTSSMGLQAKVTDNLPTPPPILTPRDKNANDKVRANRSSLGLPGKGPKAILYEEETTYYPKTTISLPPGPPDATEHQLVKTIRIARSPGPAPVKGSRPTVTAAGSLLAEPKPRTRISGRKEANTSRPSRRSRKVVNEYQQMPAVLMLMHDRSKSFSQVRMDTACSVAADICETPLTFTEFALCRPEDRKIDITGHGLDCEKIIRSIEFAFREENVGIQDVFIQHERFCVVLRTTTTKYKISRAAVDGESLPGHRDPHHMPDDTRVFQYWGMRVCDHMVAPILPSHAFYFEAREEDFQSDLDGESTVVDGLGAGPSGANFLLHKEDIVEWLETGVFTL